MHLKYTLILSVLLLGSATCLAQERYTTIDWGFSFFKSHPNNLNRIREMWASKRSSLFST